MRGEYVPYPTKAIANFPSPWGSFDLDWWVSGSAPVTTSMIVIGVVVSIVAVVASNENWWKALATYTGINVFFLFFTFLGALGCKGDGCELAQAMTVAMTWQFAIIEISLILMLIIGTTRVFLTQRQPISRYDLRRWFG